MISLQKKHSQNANILKIFFIILKKFEDLKNVSKFIDWSRGLEQDRSVN